MHGANVIASYYGHCFRWCDRGERVGREGREYQNDQRNRLPKAVSNPRLLARIQELPRGRKRKKMAHMSNDMNEAEQLPENRLGLLHDAGPFSSRILHTKNVAYGATISNVLDGLFALCFPKASTRAELSLPTPTVNRGPRGPPVQLDEDQIPERGRSD